MDPFHVIAPDKHTHFSALTDTFAKIFPDFGYFGMYTYVEQYYLGNSHYDWSVSRIGLAGDRLITHWGVWKYDTRIGAARVKTAGIGAVLTHPDFRRKGLLRKTALPSLAAARDAGYDISILFGISGYYHTFDYVRAWPRETYVVSTAALPKNTAGVKPVKLPGRMLKDMHALYNRENKYLTGTAVRPTYHTLRHDETVYYWTGSRGPLAGYVITRIHNNAFSCGEAAGDPEQILTVVAMLARKKGFRDVSFPSLHYESNLAARIRAGDCRLETQYYMNGGPMARLLNISSAFSKMCREFSRRLKQSHLYRWSGDLLIASDTEKVLLTIRNGSVRVTSPGSSRHSIRAGKELVQLLLGTDEPATLIARHGCRIRGDAKLLVPVLFPARHPQLNARDSF
jgi:hypothetical protein